MPPPKKPKNGPTSVEQFLSQDELNVLVKDKPRPAQRPSISDDEVSEMNVDKTVVADPGGGCGGDNNNVVVVAPHPSAPFKSATPPPPPPNATTGVLEPRAPARPQLVTSSDVFTTSSTPLPTSPTSDRQLPPQPVGGTLHQQKQHLKQQNRSDRKVPPQPPPLMQPSHLSQQQQQLHNPPPATIPSLLSQQTSSPPHVTKATTHSSGSGPGDDGGSPLLLLSCSNDAPKSRNTSPTINYLRTPPGLPGVSPNKVSSITNCSTTGSLSTSSSSSSAPLSSSSLLSMPSLLKAAPSSSSPNSADANATLSTASTALSSSSPPSSSSPMKTIGSGSSISLDVNRNKYGRSSSVEDSTKGTSSITPVAAPKGSILHKLFTSSNIEQCDNKGSSINSSSSNSNNNNSKNTLREQQQRQQHKHEQHHSHHHHLQQQQQHQHHLQTQTHHLWPTGLVASPGQPPTMPPGSVFTSESLLASLNYRLSTSNSLVPLVNQPAWLSPFESSRLLVAATPAANQTTSAHRIASTAGGSVAGGDLHRRTNSAAAAAAVLEFPAAAAAVAAANFSGLQQQQQQQLQQQHEQQQQQRPDGRSILAALITSQKRNPVSPEAGLSSPSSDDVFMRKGSPSPLRGSINSSANNAHTAASSSPSPSPYLSSPFLRQPNLSLQTRNLRGGGSTSASAAAVARTPNNSSSGRTESAPVYLHSAFQLHPSTTATSSSIRKNKSTSSLQLLPTSPLGGGGNNPVLPGLPPLLKMSMFSSPSRTSSSSPPQTNKQPHHHHHHNSNLSQGHPHHPHSHPPPLHLPLPSHHHLAAAAAAVAAAASTTNENNIISNNNNNTNKHSTFSKILLSGDTNAIKLNNKNTTSDPGEPYDLSVKSSNKFSDERSDSKDSVTSSMSGKSPPYTAPSSSTNLSRRERERERERDREQLAERSPSDSNLTGTTHRSPSTSEGATTNQGIESDDSSCDINVTSPVPPSSLLRLMTASVDSANRESSNSNFSTIMTSAAPTPKMEVISSVGNSSASSISSNNKISSSSSPRGAAIPHVVEPLPPSSSSNLAALLSMSTSSGAALSSSSSSSSSSQVQHLRPTATVKEEEIDIACNNNNNSSSNNNNSSSSSNNSNNNISSSYNVPYCSSSNLLHHQHHFLQHHPHHHHHHEMKMPTTTTSRGLKRYASSGSADDFDREPSDCKSPKEEVRMVSPSSCLQALPLGGAGGGDGQQSAAAGTAAAHSLQAATSTTPEPISGPIPHNFLLEMHGHNLGSSPSSSIMKQEVTGAVPGSSLQAKLCQVCNDNASGFHYGVWSCEGCKAFFKRSIQGPVDYICPATNTCTIDKHRRKSCQACRLRRCYEVGMNKGSQRKERKSSGSTLAKGKRCRADSTDSTINSTNNGTSSSKAVKRHRSASILEALQRADLPVLESQHNHNLPPTRVHLLNTLLNLINQELHNLIHWARNVPGYTNLTLSDQMHLIRCCWMELLLLNCAFRSMEHEGRKLVFAHDFHLDRQQWASTGMGAVLEQVSAVSEQMVLYGLSKEELLLLQATVLVNAEVRRLEGFMRIQEMRQTILDVFMEVANRHQGYGASNSSRQAPSILLLLTHIRQAGERGITYLQHLKMEGCVVFCDLINEMLETNNAWGGAGVGGNGNDNRRHLQQQQQHHHHLSHQQHLQSGGPPPPPPPAHPPPPHSSSHHQQQQPPPHPPPHHHSGPSPLPPPPSHPMSSD